MDLTNLQSFIQQVNNSLVSKGYNSPECNVSIYAEDKHNPFTFVFRYKNGDEYKVDVCSEKGLFPLQKAVEAYLSDLPSPDDLRKQELHTKLGRLIDGARDLDRPLDFLNPLEESMNRLSTNILENKSHAK